VLDRINRGFYVDDYRLANASRRRAPDADYLEPVVIGYLTYDRPDFGGADVLSSNLSVTF